MAFDAVCYDVYYGPSAFRMADRSIPTVNRIREAVQRFQLTPGSAGLDGNHVFILSGSGWKNENEDDHTMNEGPFLQLGVVAPASSDEAQREVLATALIRFELFMAGLLGRPINRYSRAIEGRYEPPPPGVVSSTPQEP